jgi:hypothetical protein
MNNVGNYSIFSASSISTCPGVFDYQQSTSGEWYGKISVPNPFPILAIDIVVEIYVTGDVPMVIRLPNYLLFRDILNYFLSISANLIFEK